MVKDVTYPRKPHETKNTTQVLKVHLSLTLLYVLSTIYTGAVSNTDQI